MNFLQEMNVRMNAASLGAGKSVFTAQNAFTGAMAGAGAFMMSVSPVMATATGGSELGKIFNKVAGTLREVYIQVLGISTAVAVTLCAVCLLIRMFSKNQRSIEEATQWIKRIIITWLLLNLMGMFLNYFQGLTSDSSTITWKTA